MRKFLILFILITITTITADDFLVVVNNLVEKRDFFVIQQVDDKYIAIVKEAELTLFKQRGYSYKVLDNNPREKIYYLVYPINVNDKTIAGIGKILDEFYTDGALEEYKKSLLVCVSKENRDLLFDLPVKLDYLEMNKINFNNIVVPKMSSYKVTYNPLIQKIVDDVSMDTLRATVRYLQDSVSSRSARYASNVEESIPWICNKFRKYGCDSVIQQEVPDNEYAPNPIGIKLGSEYPSYTQYYIIGGHPDCVPHEEVNKGADDNATGIAATIEAARVMRNYTFKYTIIYMGYDGEEIGFVGSGHFASEAEDRGDTILGVLNYDMVGRTSGSSDYKRISYTTDVTGCKAFADMYDEATTTYTDLEHEVVSRIGGSDQTSFWDRGYIALFLIESAYGSNDANHESWDTLDCPEGLNDSEFLTQCTQSGVAAIATAAEVVEETNVVPKSQKGVERNKFSIHHNSNGKVKINFYVNDKSEQIVLRVYNVSGKLINTIASGQYQKGAHSVIWDGCDSRGKKIARGLYFFECSTNEGRQVTRIIF